MIFRKQKAVLAAMLAVAMTATALTSVVSASGIRTKAEAYGEETYAQRALSLYNDVVTKGIENGYLSSQLAKGSDKGVGGTGFGIPYHSVETMIIEAPDYGHENTSEAMSYIAWVTAMHDALIKWFPDDKLATDTTDFKKGWITMEQMIPSKTDQPNFFSNIKAPTDDSKLESAVSAEYQDPGKYPPADLTSTKVGNPIWKYFQTAYKNDDGYYLLHWLADVDDWYGYGSVSGLGAGKFTYINSFQRGEQESCWETVPHPCIENQTYASPSTIQQTKGFAAIFQNGEINKMWRFTNAPDAEDRTIQAAYEANIWGVGDADINAAAGKMSDQLRNDMFDKYYQKIGISKDKAAGFTETLGNASNPTAGSYDSAHYLMAWYTAWGGSDTAAIQNYGGWKWQIGASHMHEFYQNPLAAYAKVYDTAINAGMKATDATKDWHTSLDRQLEFYEWLQSSTGPFAGGATNSFNGRYEGWDVNAASLEGVNSKTTFYDMFYLPHPVYMDPGSNHWIGNQVWATQRLAELYYYTSNSTVGVSKFTHTDTSTEKVNARLAKMLDKWVAWAVDGETIRVGTGDAFDYAMAESLDWSGQPDTWTGTPSANLNLTATTTAYASGDIGVVASMANTLTYYAAAKGVDGSRAHDETVLTNGTDAEKALYYATFLLDRMWTNLRDDIGIAAPGNFDASFIHRFFTQKVYIPPSYGSATMPNGGKITAASTAGSLNGCPTFYDLRPKYAQDPSFAKIKAIYDQFPSLATEDFDAEAINKYIGGNEDISTTEDSKTDIIYHRFWHEGDEIMALGSMALLYPDVVPEGSVADTTGPTVTPNSLTIQVDAYVLLSSLTVVDRDDDGNVTDKTITYSIEDKTIAELTNGGLRISAYKEGTTNLLVSDGKNVTKVPIIVSAEAGTTTTTTTPPPPGIVYGDVDVDGDGGKIADVVLLGKHVAGKIVLTGQGLINANCDTRNNAVNAADLAALIKYLTKVITVLPVTK
ncbi:hypothetical protein FACS1894132_03820 [Clostridia bacterium]|nr:hypothetical protein FACS1894132_03820 [Clostridia bacterium]